MIHPVKLCFQAVMFAQALVRPGRFDRQIYCDLPILSERTDIFNVHMRNLKLAADMPDLAERMAAFTPGMRFALLNC